MYQSIYDMILSAFFSGTAVTGWIELICTVLASSVVIFAFAVPFIVVIKLIKLICGR